MLLVGVNPELREVLHLEGHNSEYAAPQVGLNLLDLPAGLLWELFHAGRCKREHKRTGDIAYLKGYDHFLRRAVAWAVRVRGS